MKIYVSELPKNCEECPLHRSGMLKLQKGARYIDAETCVLGNFYKFQEMDDEIDTCPLAITQSLKQQARTEVVEEIRKQLKDMDFLANDTEFGERFSCYSKYKVLDILLKVERNQVKGENNVKD